MEHNSHLLAPFEKEYERLADGFCRGGLSFERAAVIMLAAGYLELMDLFRLSSFASEERDGAIERLTALWQEKDRLSRLATSAASRDD